MILETIFVAALLVTAFLSGGYTFLWLYECGVEKLEQDSASGFGNQTYATPLETDARYSADGTPL
jgi:hypothetical protein